MKIGLEKFKHLNKVVKIRGNENKLNEKRTIRFLNVNFPKIDIYQRFKGRKLLTSIEHIPVKVRW